MKQIVQKLGIPGILLVLCALPAALSAQAFGTTTVQGTVYLANGAPGSGTLQLSWPAFTTSANQAVAAGRLVAAIASDGFVSVKLAPNAGSTPAGLYYTAVYHLNDGTTSTEYWVVPAAAQATIAQVRATVMPAAQAVQAVSKTYVDQAVLQAAQSQLTASGGNLTGPLYLNGDPGLPTQAATKHYVDNQFSQALSINGGAATGSLTAVQLGAAYQADQFAGSDFGARLQACINALSSTYGGTCDARNFTGTLAMATNLTINKANVTVNLPCATITTASQIVVTAGTRNVTLHGCASRGTTAASGNQGGTVILYSGSAAAIQAGDATYASDTLGFHLDNVVINTTAATASTAQAVAVWRTQELHLEALYLLGNGNQTGVTLDGTGNYTGGTLTDVQIGGFQTAINGIGHQQANPATTDWVNASTFVRLHINCPTASGNPIAGTTGINLLQGDGNMFSGGDVEECATALHMGPNAQNNTIVGLRNENSSYQVVADAGSAYNNWMTGGTMFTGRLTDNGTRNSFLDTFHRSFNGLNGDWYGSQQDATLTNHLRLGIGSGNERGLLNRYQTDYGYRWTMGLTDATAGEQYYQVLDELNNVNRLSIGQYNHGQGSSNNQTVINAAGTGAIVLNGSNNAGSGGVVFGSGGPSSTTVATINNAGNALFTGTLQVGGTTTFVGSPSVKNQADAEIDYLLQAGATAPQKESVIYKDWNGASQWYMVKDASNNWALNSAVGGVDSFKAYQSTNSGDTYIDAANNTGVVRVNYEPGSGSAFNVYGGSSASLYASFNGTTGIKFPGLASSSGKNCVQIDNSGYLSNTGSSCAGSAVGAGTTGQIAFYPGNGSSLAGMSAVPIGSGGTGATSAGAALTSLGGLALSGGTLTGALTGTDATFSGQVQAQNMQLGSDRPTDHQAASANAAVTTFSVLAFGGKGDGAFKSATTWFTGSMTAGSNVMTVSIGSSGRTAPAVGMYVYVFNVGVQPFADIAFAPASGWTQHNTAQITSISGNQWTLSKTALNTFNTNIGYGTDNVPAQAACQLAAATVIGTTGGTCTYPHGGYLFATAPYYILGGHSDDGAYGQPGGGSGAVLAPSLGTGSTAGQITGIAVMNGGSGYTPGSQLQVRISGGCTGPFGYDGGPCGWAFALANTDSSGHVDSVTVVYPGYGFTATPTATVLALGGDGARATATISGGSINGTTVTAGGSGYPANGSIDVWGLQGSSGCAAIKTVDGAVLVAQGTASTNSSGQVTSIAFSNAGSGCASAPALIFGDVACNTSTSSSSPVYIQCANKPPLNPVMIPTHIVASQSMQGMSGNEGGVWLLSTWDGRTVDNNQICILCGSITHQDITGLTFDGFLDIYDPFNMNYSNIENNSFYGGIGMITGSTDVAAMFNRLVFNSYASWVNGGMWWHRVNSEDIGGGFFNAYHLDKITVTPPAYSATAAAIDDWYNNNFWNSEYSAYSPGFPESCKFPQTPNQRQTTMDFTYPVQGNVMCYRAITARGLDILTRGGVPGANNATLDTLMVKGASRNVFYGAAGSMIINNAGCEVCGGIVNDPYRNASSEEGAVTLIESPNAQPTLTAVTYASAHAATLPNRCIYSMTTGGDPANAVWSKSGCSAQNVQATINPGLSSIVLTTAGYNLPGNCGANAPCRMNVYGLTNTYTSTLEGNWEGYTSGGTATGIQYWNPAHNAAWLSLLSTGLSTTLNFSAPSVSINGGTPITSTSSANSQAVTCAAGGSGTQYCGADGAWHTPAATGPSSVNAGAGLSGGGSNGAVALSCSIAQPGTLGCMKPDNSTITCNASTGVCSASLPSGSGMPAGCTQYPCTIAALTPATITPALAGFNNLSPVAVSSTYTVSGNALLIPSGYAGQYRICENMDTTVAGTGSSNWALDFTVTSADGHQWSYMGSNVANATQWSKDNGSCWNVYTDGVGAGSAIQFQIYNASPPSAAATLRYSATVEKIQ